MALWDVERKEIEEKKWSTTHVGIWTHDILIVTSVLDLYATTSLLCNVWIILRLIMSTGALTFVRCDISKDNKPPEFLVSR